MLCDLVWPHLKSTAFKESPFPPDRSKAAVHLAVGLHHDPEVGAVVSADWSDWHSLSQLAEFSL